MDIERCFRTKLPLGVRGGVAVVLAGRSGCATRVKTVTMRVCRSGAGYEARRGGCEARDTDGGARRCDPRSIRIPARSSLRSFNLLVQYEYSTALSVAVSRTVHTHTVLLPHLLGIKFKGEPRVVSAGAIAQRTVWAAVSSSTHTRPRYSPMPAHAAVAAPLHVRLAANQEDMPRTCGHSRRRHRTLDSVHHARAGQLINAPPLLAH